MMLIKPMPSNGLVALHAQFVCVFIGLILTADILANELASTKHSAYENQLVAIVQAINSGNLDDALRHAEQHIISYPKSKAGRLLKDDILESISHAATEFTAGQQAKVNPKIVEIRKQLDYRLKHIENHNPALLPAALVDIGEHPFVLVGDLKAGRLYLYGNDQGKPILLYDYYMSVGKQGYGKQHEGDNKTPIGVYSVIGYKDGKTLPDLYGAGAFPVNYPNKVDRYHKRNGYGIWLHGTPSDTYARRPWASEGCFVISNEDFEHIGQFLDANLRTPVILSDDIKWITWHELLDQRANIFAILQSWENDWESLDIQAYLNNYQQTELNFGKTDVGAWKKRKLLVSHGKEFIEIERKIHSLFRYPGEPDMFVVRYQQVYTSNNHSDIDQKQQYWQRGLTGQWRIIYEE